MLFNGLGVAMVTPMNKDNKGSIDYNTTSSLIEFLIDSGVDAIIALGTTGEGSTLTTSERQEFLQFVTKTVNSRVEVIAGTGSNCTLVAVQQSIMARDLGVDGLLVVTPYYNKCTQNGCFAHYKAISDAVDLPIIAYNVPKRTGFNITPSLAKRLCEISNLKAIKEASGDMNQIIETILAVEGRLKIYCGDDNLTTACMAMGASGVISVSGNIVPSLMKKTVSGDIFNASKVQLSLNPLINLLFCEVNPIPIKGAMGLIGFDCGYPRLPLTKAEDDTILKIKSELIKLGVI